jgi:hypothetical protein
LAQYNAASPHSKHISGISLVGEKDTISPFTTVSNLNNIAPSTVMGIETVKPLLSGNKFTSDVCSNTVKLGANKEILVVEASVMV